MISGPLAGQTYDLELNRRSQPTTADNFTIFAGRIVNPIQGSLVSKPGKDLATANLPSNGAS
jgi:hypothetical protein